MGKHVKVIQHDALMDTKLKELRFPASVKELQDIGPFHASDVYLESSNIPSYFPTCKTDDRIFQIPPPYFISFNFSS